MRQNKNKRTHPNSILDIPAIRIPNTNKNFAPIFGSCNSKNNGIIFFAF